MAVAAVAAVRQFLAAVVVLMVAVRRLFQAHLVQARPLRRQRLRRLHRNPTRARFQTHALAAASSAYSRAC